MGVIASTLKRNTIIQNEIPFINHNTLRNVLSLKQYSTNDHNAYYYYLILTQKELYLQICKHFLFKITYVLDSIFSS